jgi:ketosteroid isomerase-like protein
MRELTINFGVTCLAFASAAFSNALAAETDEQSIHETYKAWVEATNLASTEEVISYYARSFADPRFSLDCRQEYVDVSESGEMAWSRGECKATFTGPDGNEASVTSRWLKVWIKQSDGSWRCRVNTWRNVDQL